MNTHLHWRKYGEATTIPFSLISLDTITLLTKAEWTPAAGEVKYSYIDSGVWQAIANTTNLPTSDANPSNIFNITLTAAEMSHKQVHVNIFRAATFMPCSLTVVTFGSSSAQYAFDLSSPSLGVALSPIQANVQSNLMVDTDISVYQTAEAPSLIFTILDDNDVPIDLSSATLSFKVYDRSNTVLFTRTTGGSGITISGSSNNLATVTYTATNTATAGAYKYALWRTDSDDIVYAAGDFVIKPVVK